MDWKKEILQNCEWKEEISNKEEKEKVAKIIASKVKDGDVIGFGSGSTSFLAAIEIGKRLEKENIKITAIPTSHEIKMLCTYLNIPTADIMEKRPDWCFDGADEVNEKKWLIKGRGAAMYNEKFNIALASKTYILVDKSKFVDRLGKKFAIPIEITPKALNYVKEELFKIGAQEITLRLALRKDGPVITENGNFILDTKFNEITENLENKIKCITGVIESGLFINYNVEIIN